MSHDAQTQAAGEPADATPDPGEKGPARRCFVTFAVLPKERMVRFVVGPEGAVVADIDGRLPGRGLWLTASRDIVARATTRRLFAKAARATVTVPADLPDRIEAQLAARCLSWIGLARRAGQAVAGFEKVRGWLAEGRAALIIEASDAARHGVSKLDRWRGDGIVVRSLTASELGQAFGRDRAVHVAVAPGRLARALATDAARLAGFRDGGTAGGDAERKSGEAG
ncbi:MAG: RNA-binding protein [Alphaproteobacteria bacterium]|nr:RNA-binding protein [Alphaproteobacteria bacterium]